LNGKDESVNDDELRKGCFSETEQQEQQLNFLLLCDEYEKEESSKLFLPRIIE
jgi:hypothetical protein